MDYLEELEKQEDQMSPTISKYDANKLKLDIASARERVSSISILCITNLVIERMSLEKYVVMMHWYNHRFHDSSLIHLSFIYLFISPVFHRRKSNIAS